MRKWIILGIGVSIGIIVLGIFGGTALTGTPYFEIDSQYDRGNSMQISDSVNVQVVPSERVKQESSPKTTEINLEDTIGVGDGI